MTGCGGGEGGVGDAGWVRWGCGEVGVERGERLRIGVKLVTG